VSDGPASPTTRPRPACSAHPRARAVLTCAGCGLFLCGECAIEGGRCPRCRGAGHPIAWEDPTVSRPIAFWRTFKALGGVGKFFALLPWSGGLRAPLSFAATAATVGAVGDWAISALANLVFGWLIAAVLGGGLTSGGGSSSSLADFAPAEYHDLFARGQQVLDQVSHSWEQLAILALLLTPVVTVLDLYVSGAITHALARLLGGRGTFEATIRAMAYATGAETLKPIPLVGSTLATFGGLVLSITGLQRAHGVSGPRAFVLALWKLPVLIVLGAVCLLLAAHVLLAVHGP
jgi:hypothetical protein